MTAFACLKRAALTVLAQLCAGILLAEYRTMHPLHSVLLAPCGQHSVFRLKHPDAAPVAALQVQVYLPGKVGLPLLSIGPGSVTLIINMLVY